MSAERLYIAQIRWKEREETDVEGATRVRERSQTVPVWATDYWKVYPELLARNAIPEQRHEVEVWRVKEDGDGNV